MALEPFPTCKLENMNMRGQEGLDFLGKWFGLLECETTRLIYAALDHTTTWTDLSLGTDQGVPRTAAGHCRRLDAYVTASPAENQGE